MELTAPLPFGIVSWRMRLRCNQSEIRPMVPRPRVPGGEFCCFPPIPLPLVVVGVFPFAVGFGLWLLARHQSGIKWSGQVGFWGAVLGGMRGCCRPHGGGPGCWRVRARLVRASAAYRVSPPFFCRWWRQNRGVDGLRRCDFRCIDWQARRRPETGR